MTAPAALPLVDGVTLARVLHVHPSNVFKLVRENMPVAVQGTGGRASRYDVVACVGWYLNRERAQLSSSATAGALDVNQERAKLFRAQREKTEQQTKRDRGKLVALAKIQRIRALFVACVTGWRNGLLSIPSQFFTARPDVPRDAIPVLDDLLRRKLDDMADGVATSGTSSNGNGAGRHAPGGDADLVTTSDQDDDPTATSDQDDDPTATSDRDDLDRNLQGGDRHDDPAPVGRQRAARRARTRRRRRRGSAVAGRARRVHTAPAGALAGPASGGRAPAAPAPDGR
jgi:phage terminase Nu1 subunit (DNA packaging protein)